jgi:hypothetical protein
LELKWIAIPDVAAQALALSILKEFVGVDKFGMARKCVCLN